MLRAREVGFGKTQAKVLWVCSKGRWDLGVVVDEMKIVQEVVRSQLVHPRVNEDDKPGSK